MANGKRTIRRCSLYSEDLLDNRGTRCLILLLHVVSLILGLAGTVLGALSFANDPDDPIPQTNCSLTTSIQQSSEYPLNLHLLLTGLVLILIDMALTFLLCIFKWKRCGVLAISWFLVMTVLTLTWIVISILYLVVVVSVWLDDKVVCDYLVMLMALVSVGYCGVLGLTYLIVIVVVFAYDCTRWRNSRTDF